ncbi:unnamed protein product [Acanthoscelides obtectus]|uniref:FAM69 protein-kinase domain-containing protein n=1 Tax=Acanthoscelides obtectus TaxID=200917 RepID=A0A9P0PL66_ACAOB|nr:unnamed protein product [Acanthoscelides obtectus]CAK1648843.1 Deleted in autism protein 1 [Acanthoscelides obtectus]
MGERTILLQTKSSATRFKKMTNAFISVKWTMILMLLPVMLSLYKCMQKTVLDLCELDSCPLCYGTNMCSEIQAGNVTLQYNTLKSAFYNIFSVKNVYFAKCGGKNCILKKLVHRHEFLEIGSHGDTEMELVKYLMSVSDIKKFKICNQHTAEEFLKQLKYDDIRHIDILLQLNVEPLLLQIFNKENDWPIPKFYGSCGRLAIMEYAGKDLNTIEHADWFKRAYVAHKILEAAINFTLNHPVFRLYLTDISPDNIVVDDQLRISFVDLEHGILNSKLQGKKNLHASDHYLDENYAFSESEICHSDISDHNIYSVCKLLLSQFALWPMMNKGLLHDPPEHVKKEYSNLFIDIEDCLHSKEGKDRFLIADHILDNLSLLLKNNVF